MTEDIGHKIDISQFAGKKGVVTEHPIVKLRDRVLSLLDRPGMKAVIDASVDWLLTSQERKPRQLQNLSIWD